MGRNLLEFERSLGPSAAYLWVRPAALTQSIEKSAESPDDAYIEYYFQRYKQMLEHTANGNIIRLAHDAYVARKNPKDAIDAVRRMVVFMVGADDKGDWIESHYSQDWINALIDSARKKFEQDYAGDYRRQFGASEISVQFDDNGVEKIKNSLDRKNTTPGMHNMMTRNLELFTMRVEMAAALGVDPQITRPLLEDMQKLLYSHFSSLGFKIRTILPRENNQIAEFKVTPPPVRPISLGGDLCAQTLG